MSKKFRRRDKNKERPKASNRFVTKEHYTPIPTGLIAIRGFKESGLHVKNNFARAKEVFVTYTQRFYPRLVRMVENPFGTDVKVKIPDILRKRKDKKEKSKVETTSSDEEGDIDMESEAGKMLQNQIVKDYTREVKQLELDKSKLAGDLWSILGKYLQERLKLKSDKEVADQRRIASESEEDYDDEVYIEQHSRASLSWLWRSVHLIMSLGETASEDPSLLLINAKKAI